MDNQKLKRRMRVSYWPKPRVRQLVGFLRHATQAVIDPRGVVIAGVAEAGQVAHHVIGKTRVAAARVVDQRDAIEPVIRIARDAGRLAPPGGC